MEICSLCASLLVKNVINECCCCSVAKSCPILCNPVDYSMPGLPVLHYLPEFAQAHVLHLGDAIQPCHCLSLPFPPALKLSQHQSLFQWVGSFHQMAKVLELQLHHQPFQWIFQGWFSLGLTGLMSLLSKGLSKSILQCHSSKASILCSSALLSVQLSH